MKNTHIFLSIALLTSIACSTHAVQTRWEEKNQCTVDEPWEKFCAVLWFKSLPRVYEQEWQGKWKQIAWEESSVVNMYNNLSTDQQEKAREAIQKYNPGIANWLKSGSSQ